MTDLGGVDGAQRRLLLEALVSYSDACRLPDLTPTCPYYRLERGTPTCGDECTKLIAVNGGGQTRAIGEINIGGLVMTGRTVPVYAAGSGDPYDAMRNYIDQRGRRPVDQSTGTLLLALSATFNKVPWESHATDVIRAHELFAELERRGVPVDAVMRSAIIPQIATQISLLATAQLVREDGLWDELVSDDELDRVTVNAAPWVQVLQTGFDQDGGEHAVLQLVEHLDAEHINQNLTDLFRVQPGDDVVDDSSLRGISNAIRGHALKDMRIPYAMSRRFTNRLEQWLNRLLGDDMAAVLRWAVPPLAVFTALPPSSTPDEVGRWIWDRFTHTSLDEWADSSLLREYAGNADGTLKHRVWLERTCDASEVASLALSRLTAKTRRAAPEPKLRAETFVRAAIEHLSEGRAAEAAEIFRGLVELRPTDGDALNNFGFCLLAVDPAAALVVLQRSSLFPMSQRTVNAANRVLALWLVGRRDDALELAAESMNMKPPADEVPTCYGWTLSSNDEITLSSTTPGQYLEGLVTQIRRSADEGSR